MAVTGNPSKAAAAVTWASGIVTNAPAFAGDHPRDWPPYRVRPSALRERGAAERAGARDQWEPRGDGGERDRQTAGEPGGGGDAAPRLGAPRRGPTGRLARARRP